MKFDMDLAKKTYKLILIVAAIGCALYSMSIFASTTPNTSTNVPPLMDHNNAGLAAPYGQPFLLERGYADVSKWLLGTSDGSTGAYQFVGCSGDPDFSLPDAEAAIPPTQDYYGSGKGDLPYCIAILTTQKKCPSTGFFPVVKVSPIAATTVAYTPIFACIPQGDITGTYNTGVSDNPPYSGYAVKFATPAASDSNGTGWGPFISVNWELWCYPTIKRTAGDYGVSGASANVVVPNMEQCNIPKPNTLNNSPYIWEIGNVTPTPPPAAGQPIAVQTFSTTKRCPVNWGYFIAISKPATEGNNPDPTSGVHELAGPSGACIQNIKVNYDTYTVSYLVKASILELDNDGSTSLTFNDPDYPKAMPNVHWTLYCYPPNLTPPTNNGADPGICDVSVKPYAQ